MQYFKDHETILDKYALLDGFSQCEKYLLEYPFLCSEYATSYLTIEALNQAIDQNVRSKSFCTKNMLKTAIVLQETLMAKYASNCITLQYLLELAKSLRELPTNKNVIQSFFKKCVCLNNLLLFICVCNLQNSRRRCLVYENVR